MGTVWVSCGWTRRKPLENQGASGAGNRTRTCYHDSKNIKRAIYSVVFQTACKTK